MSWLGKVFGREGGSEGLTLLKLRVTRFRQLMRSYGTLLELLEDAAEKQGGGFVFDRQYVIALAEGAAELGDAVSFDLNVLTGQRHLAFYEKAEALRAELREILTAPPAPDRARAPLSGRPPEADAVSPAALAAALAGADAAYRGLGRVACRGVAFGRVVNAVSGADLGALADGDVLVARDLDDAPDVLASAARAAAILLDRGSASGPTARLARERRIPSIVGLGDATTRLAAGTEVTVDADEGTVYLGRIAELLDYDRWARDEGGEEDEYRLLRAVRRAVFPLTLSTELTQPTLRDCRSVHDLVHLGHTIAGDALFELLTSGVDLGAAPVPFPASAAPEGYVIDLDGGLGGQAEPDGSLRSRPLRALLAGVQAGAAEATDRMLVVAGDERALAVVRRPSGFDMIDSTASATDAANLIYCRFAPRGADDPGGVRGAVAAGVLARLGFAAAGTGRDVSGWLRGLPGAEVERRLRALGRLIARLGHPSDAGWRGVEAEEIVTAVLDGEG